MDHYNPQSPRRMPPQANGHPTPSMRQGPGSSQSTAGTPDPLRPTTSGSASALSRAEKFEDEKQRIMKSCFSKRDEKGQLLQSYITHIRVEEDAMYPSDPPPASADPQYKKARVIMVAVKNTGRVYMHKARENTDNTFQIGKSWPLEDLAQIESFSPDLERGPEDASRAQLGGPAGLVITMNKPYYWKAMTAKEKEFFVASLCKIYRKYTSGQVPKLKGFTPREEGDILGASQAPPAAPRAPGPPQANAPPPGAIPGGPPPPLRPDGGRGSPGQSPARPAGRAHRPSDVSMDPSMRTASNDSSSQRPPSPLRHRNITPNIYDRTQTPPQQPSLPGTDAMARTRPQPSQESGQLRPTASREIVNGGRLQPQGLPPHRLSPQSSHSNFSRASPGPMSDAPLRSPRFPPGSATGSPEPIGRLQKAASPEVLSGAMAATERLRSPGLPPASPRSNYHDSMLSNGNSSILSVGSDTPASNGKIPPVRRRPPLEDAAYGQNRPDADAMPQPLKSKSSQPSIPRSTPEPALLNDLPRMPGAFSSGSTPSATPPPPLEASGRDPPKTSAESVSPPPQAVPPPPAAPPASLANTGRPTTPQATVQSKPRAESPATLNTSVSGSPSKKSEEQQRPGLVPTVNEPVTSPTARSKHWNKAFNAANTAAKLKGFTPRAGGAAGRLFAEKKETGEPDGITGVIPAPSPSLPRTDGAASSTQADRDSAAHSAPNSQTRSAPSSADLRADRLSAGAGLTGLGLVAETEAEPKPVLPSKFNESLAVLGIDAGLLAGRGQEYEATLANFGWTDNILRTKTIETLETSLRKEVGKLEAGSWLGYSDGKDDRIEEFEKMLDRAIAECDEMEGLLTLYGVELSTLNEDVSYIETQSGGIQVQTANQKLLQKELQSLLKSQEAMPGR